MTEPWFTLKLRDESLRTPKVDAWLAEVQRRLHALVPDPVAALLEAEMGGFKVPMGDDDGA